jgi:hypothetical protein
VLLKELLNAKFESKGFSLSPSQDTGTVRVNIMAPEDSRAIKNFPIDSEGRYKYQVSVNVQLSLASRGIKKNIGNIKMSGLGSSELDALQRAQENVANHISDKVIDSLRSFNVL